MMTFSIINHTEIGENRVQEGGPENLFEQESRDQEY